MDWLVTYYDDLDNIMYAYEIHNRTETEAENEVEKDLAQGTDVFDWTLSPLNTGS